MHLPNLSSEYGWDAKGVAGRTSPTVLSNLRMAYVYSAGIALNNTGGDTTQCARRHRVLRRAIEHDARFDRLDLGAFFQRGEGAEDVAPI